jgi:hypothetical protein
MQSFNQTHVLHGQPCIVTCIGNWWLFALAVPHRLCEAHTQHMLGPLDCSHAHVLRITGLYCFFP